jgi:serpin B
MDLSRWLSGPPSAAPPARLREDWVNSLNGFALALAQRMARGGSYAVSPHNIASALALLAAGARGDTLEKLCRTLGIAAEVDAAPKFGKALRRVVPRGEASPLVVGAGVWHDRRLTLTPEYVDLATSKFAARVSPVDFGRPDETADDVNAWIVDLTRGNITNLISARDITPDMVAILCTGMFFKGTWKTKFDVARTTPGVFHGINGD